MHHRDALRGDGAYRNDTQIRVSDVGSLEHAHFYYSSMSWFIKAGCPDAFVELVKRTERQRGFGEKWRDVFVRIYPPLVGGICAIANLY